ncbi:MAG: MASE3 domain-containing protein [Deltaproteobacteria bacterium]
MLMRGRLAIPNQVGIALAGVVVVLFSLLVVIGPTHHLFFPSTFELLSVIVAWTIFLTMRHFRHLLFDPFFLTIGTGCLFIGILGLVQAVISGEAIATGIASGDLNVQLSIVTGALQSGTLLGALLSFRRSIKPVTLFVGYSLACGLALASIFLWHTFPDCYRSAIGLTSFARGSISFIILFLVAAAGLLYQRLKPLLPTLFPILFAAVIFAILAELSFDTFTGIASNIFHHAFELTSLFCIFLAFLKAGRQGASSDSPGLDDGFTLNKKTVEEVVQANRDWERTFDAVPDLITILDSNHRIKRVNRAVADKFGKQPREMIGKQCFEFMHRTAQPIESCPLSQVLGDGQPHTTEIYEPSLDSHFLVNVVPLRNEKGELDGVVHVARDITESKRAEQLRRESEERYRILFEQAAELLFLFHLDENGQPETLSEVNDATCRILGYTREEMQRRSLSDLCEKGADGKLCPMPSPGQRGLVTLMLIAKNGMRVLVEASSHLFEFKGRPTVLSVGRDITERKVMELELQRYQGRLEKLVHEKTAELVEMNKTLRNEVLERTEVEKTLRENEHYLRQLIEEFNGLLQAIPDTLILLSQDLKILWTNKASDGGVRPSQRSPDGLTCHQLWAGRTTPCTDCPTLRSFSSGQPEHSQVHIADGRTWEVRAFPIGRGRQSQQGD